MEIILADIEEVKNSILKWHYGILVYNVNNIKEEEEIKNKRSQFKNFTSILYDKIGDKNENGTIETILTIEYMKHKEHYLLTNYSDKEKIINHILVLETNIIDYCQNNKSFIDIFKRNISSEHYELFRQVISKNNEGKEECMIDAIITGDRLRIKNSLEECFKEAKEIYPK